MAGRNGYRVSNPLARKLGAWTLRYLRRKHGPGKTLGEYMAAYRREQRRQWVRSMIVTAVGLIVVVVIILVGMFRGAF
jgi:hypothetical protein